MVHFKNTLLRDTEKDNF